MQIETEFYVGMGMYKIWIKTLEGIILPFMPRGEAIVIDGEDYKVRTYTLIVGEDKVTAKFWLEK